MKVIKSEPIYFSTNIRRLRALKKINQEELAERLGIKRSKVNSYENRVALNPPLDDLLKFSMSFNMSIDTLLRVDLTKLNELQIRELQSGNDVYLRGGTLRILATTINADNRDNIELVGVRAKAGYTAGYKDPEFISALPTFTLPFLSENKKYRTFQLDGDSMTPIPDGAYVIGEYLQDWRQIKDGHAYVILTKDEGIVFKVVYNQIRKKQNLLLRSLNAAYKPYELPIEDVLEVWKFINFISKELPGQLTTNEKILLELEDIKNRIVEKKN